MNIQWPDWFAGWCLLGVVAVGTAALLVGWLVQLRKNRLRDDAWRRELDESWDREIAARSDAHERARHVSTLRPACVDDELAAELRRRQMMARIEDPSPAWDGMVTAALSSLPSSIESTPDNDNGSSRSHDASPPSDYSGGGGEFGGGGASGEW